MKPCPCRRFANMGDPQFNKTLSLPTFREDWEHHNREKLVPADVWRSAPRWISTKHRWGQGFRGLCFIGARQTSAETGFR